MGEAKHWYNHHVGSSQGDWEVLCSNFCLQFFPIQKVAKLHLEILSFEQHKNESLSKAWEYFDSIVNSGPSLALPEPMVLQHFLGLNRKTKKYLNLVAGGAFMHITAERVKTILMNTLNNIPEEREELLEETQIGEPELLLKSSQPLAVLEPELTQEEEEETPLSDFMLNFEDDLFTKFENTSNYHVIMKPHESRKSKNINFLHLDDVEFLKKITQELVSVLSDEWLEESELLNEIIHLDYPSITIQYQIDKYPFDTFYNPVVDVNIMSVAFAKKLLEDMPLIPTNKLLKSLSGHIIPSLRILCVLPIIVNGFQVQLNFYIFDV
jgi:hypothetical protein